MTINSRTLAVLLVCAGLLAGCGGTPEADAATDAAYTVVDAENLAVVDASGVVLTVHSPKADDTLVEFDLQSLEALGLVEYTIADPQATGLTATFQGVLVSRLLDTIGVVQDTTTLRITALNDYAVDMPIEDALDYPVLIATRMNGEPMNVANYGPTRIVYPTHAFEFEKSVYDPRWIWQLASIEVL